MKDEVLVVFQKALPNAEFQVHDHPAGCSVQLIENGTIVKSTTVKDVAEAGRMAILFAGGSLEGKKAKGRRDE